MDENNDVLNFKNNKILFAASFDDTNVLNRKQLIDAIINNIQTGNYEVKYNVLLDCPTPFCELDLFVGNLCKTISEHYGCKTCKTWNDVVFASKTTEDSMEVISVVFNIGFEKPKN